MAASGSTDTARAWQVPRVGAKASDLQLITFPIPRASARDDVVLRVICSEISYADHVVLSGAYKPSGWRAGEHVIPGCSIIGIVVETGGDVTALRVGDRVAVMPMRGGFATHVVVPARTCIKIERDEVPGDEAVIALMTGVTAYSLLTTTSAARVIAARTPERVRMLVHSCSGGTGAMIVQVAKALGMPAGNIYGTCSAHNVSQAREALGITAFDYRATGAEAWDARVMNATGGEGVDVVLDAVTFKGYYERGMAVLRRGGAYVSYGFTNSTEPGVVVVPSLIGLFLRSALNNALWTCATGKTAQVWLGGSDVTPEFQAAVRAVLRLMASGAVRPLVGRVWPFEGARDALMQLAAGGSHVGKQLLHVADV